MTEISPLRRLLRRKDYRTVSVFLNEILKGNLSFQSEDIIDCLKSGHPEVEFLALKILKRFPDKFKKESIKEIFKMEDREVDSFLNNRTIEFSFPAVSEKEEKLVRGVAVYLDSNRIISNNKKVVSIPVLKKGCLVFFDSRFEGNSFQAALLLALSCGGYPEKYLFTGTVDSDGNIHADMVEKKQEVARKNSKVLIYGGNIMSLIKIFKERKIDVPLLLSTVPDIPSLHKLCRAANINIEMVQELVNVTEKQLLFSLPQYVPIDEEWSKYVLDIRKKLYEIKSHIETSIDRAVFHIALRMPSPLAMGIGASIGTGKFSLALYHFESGKYVKLIDLTTDSRKIKKRKTVRNNIAVTRDAGYSGSERCIVGIQLASHQIKGKALDKLISNVEGDFFFIEHIEHVGALPLNSDWAEIVAEINSQIADIHENYSEIHLVMSVPVIVAFALGMALGHYWNINLYQLDNSREEYVKVLNLKDIPVV